MNYNPNSSGAGKKRRSYKSFPFVFEEFYNYCEQYIAQFGYLNVPVRCVILPGEDGPIFIRNATPEQNEQKIYDFGIKIKAVRDGLEMDGNTSAYGKIVLTQVQYDKLDDLSSTWRSNEDAEFEELYHYVALYKEYFGSLNVPVKCVAVKEDGKVVFVSKKYMPKAEREKVVCFIGDRMARMILLSTEKDNSLRRKKYTHRHFDRFTQLDPYWNYPINVIGDRIDPVTGENVDAIKVGSVEIMPNKRRNNAFEYAQFYSYALLYWTEFGNLNIHKKTVAVKKGEVVSFARYEQALVENWPIIYNFGRYFTEIRQTKASMRTGEESILKQPRYLTEEQYKQLDELDKNWSKEQGYDNDAVYQEWYAYLDKHPTIEKKIPKAKSSNIEKSEKINCEKINAPQHHIPREVRQFNFEIFYSLCQHQKHATGQLEFSKAKVVDIDKNVKNSKYRIGQVWHYVVATKKYEMCEEKDLAIKPDFLLNLTKEQEQKLAALEPFWYLSSKEKRDLRRASRIQRRAVREIKISYRSNNGKEY